MLAPCLRQGTLWHMSPWSSRVQCSIPHGSRVRCHLSPGPSCLPYLYNTEFPSPCLEGYRNVYIRRSVRSWGEDQKESAVFRIFCNPLFYHQARSSKEVIISHSDLILVHKNVWMQTLALNLIIISIYCWDGLIKSYPINKLLSLSRRRKCRASEVGVETHKHWWPPNIGDGHYGLVTCHRSHSLNVPPSHVYFLLICKSIFVFLPPCKLAATSFWQSLNEMQTKEFVRNIKDLQTKSLKVWCSIFIHESV